MDAPDWDDLIPELKRWNNDAGIDPEGWRGCSGSFQLACAYSLLFWPRFMELDGMVFRGEMSRQMLDSWKANCSSDPAKIEATANHIHISDVQYVGCPDLSLERVLYLGKLLKEIYQVKLAADFPDRSFVVDFYEPPDKKLGEYQLTFYQKPLR
jgi:hypothetical protein